MNSGGERVRAAYSRVRRLWAARVAMVCVCMCCESVVGGMSCDSGGEFARAMDWRLEGDFVQYSRALMFVNVLCSEFGE